VPDVKYWRGNWERGESVSGWQNAKPRENPDGQESQRYIRYIKVKSNRSSFTRP
jgi:hypothetical protein